MEQYQAIQHVELEKGKKKNSETDYYLKFSKCD